LRRQRLISISCTTWRCPLSSAETCSCTLYKKILYILPINNSCVRPLHTVHWLFHRRRRGWRTSWLVIPGFARWNVGKLRVANVIVYIIVGGGGVVTVSICICNLCLIFKNCVTKVMSKSPSRHLVRVHRKWKLKSL